MRHFAEQSRPELSWLLRVMLATVLLLVVMPALAQEAAQPAPEPQETEAEEEEAAADERPAYQEVVNVTARKREESLQEVPVAVTVVQGDELEDAGAMDISDLQIAVPNLSIYSGRNQSTTMTAFMRGIGQADPLWGVDPGVGLYLDDVYIARPQGALLDVFDIDRLEVLRGPQGTLYGKNTIGGAIKYVSRDLTDKPEGYISFTPGMHENRDVKFGISGPIVKGKLRGKIAFASLRHAGYGTNLHTGMDNSDKNTMAFRAVLDWLPSDNVSVKFAFDKTDDDAQPKGYARLSANPLCPLFLGGETCDPLPGLFDTESGLEPTNGTVSEGYSMVVNWGINDNWTFKSITAYRDSDSENNIDFDTTPALIADVESWYFDDQTSQEFQFIYDGGNKFNGVFGLYYFDGFAGGLVHSTFFGSVFFRTDGDTNTESKAVFGDGSYAITDKLTFNLGLRATEEEKKGRAYNFQATDNTFQDLALLYADYDNAETFSSVSPRIGFDYQFSDDVMGYITASRGFKSGGFNVRAQSEFFPDSALPFDDEQLTVVEVGAKTLLANRSLVLNAAAFYGDYTDVQVSLFTAIDINSDGVDEFFGNILNAGDATLKGVELEFNWKSRAADWFGISGNLSYLDAEPDTFVDEDTDGFVDAYVISNAPEITGALNLNFYAPLKCGLLTSTISYGYRDDSMLTNEGGETSQGSGIPLEPIVQPSYSMLNARIGWLHKDGKWGITLNGKNLTDEEYLTNGYNLPTFGVLTGSYGQPLTVTATFDYTFF